MNTSLDEAVKAIEKINSSNKKFMASSYAIQEMFGKIVHYSDKLSNPGSGLHGMSIALKHISEGKGKEHIQDQMRTHKNLLALEIERHGAESEGAVHLSKMVSSYEKAAQFATPLKLSTHAIEGAVAGASANATGMAESFLAAAEATGPIGAGVLLVAAAVGSVVYLFKQALSLSYQFVAASKNATSDLEHRNQIFQKTIAAQVTILASTEQMKEALSAATEYGMDLDDNFQSELENLVKVNYALGISGMEAAKMDRSFRAVGTSLVQVSKSMANIKEISILTGQEIAGISRSISDAALGTLNFNTDMKSNLAAISAGETLMKKYGQPVGQLTALFNQMSDITDKGNLSFMFGLSPSFMGEANGAEKMLMRMSAYLKVMSKSGYMSFGMVASQLGLNRQQAAVLAKYGDELQRVTALNKLAMEYTGERNDLEERYQNLLSQSGDVWKNLIEIVQNFIALGFGEWIVRLNAFTTAAIQARKDSIDQENKLNLIVNALGGKSESQGWNSWDTAISAAFPFQKLFYEIGDAFTKGIAGKTQGQILKSFGRKSVASGALEPLLGVPNFKDEFNDWLLQYDKAPLETHEKMLEEEKEKISTYLRDWHGTNTDIDKILADIAEILSKTDAHGLGWQKEEKDRYLDSQKKEQVREEQREEMWEFERDKFNAPIAYFGRKP